MDVHHRVESQDEAATRIGNELSEVCGQLNLAYARLALLVADAVEHQLPATGTLLQWLGWQTGLSSGHLRQVLRIAAAADTHPAVRARFDEGLLSVDQAALAVRAPAQHDAEIARLATLSTVPQLRQLVRAARPSDSRPDALGKDREEVSTSFDDDGRLLLRGRLDPDHGRIVDDALNEARDALFHAGQPDVSWADALVEMARRSLDAVDTAERRERFRSYLFIDPLLPVAAHWADGIAVPDWLVSHTQCDGTVAPVFVAQGRPVSVGRAQYTPPERTRRVVLHRDGTCRVPWCAQARWLQIHHVVHREHGGSTDTDNLVALCATHHRQHHQGLLGITGNADLVDGLTFTDAHGRRLDPSAHPRPTAPPLSPRRRYAHPLGEPLERWSVHFEHAPPATG